MDKLLYLTDQNENKEHSFIGPLFEKYLGKHYEVDIMYFSKISEQFQIKNGNRFIMPLKHKHNIINELTNNGISLKNYKFVFVRNHTAILKEVLSVKNQYSFKLGYRLSFPKRIAKLQKDEANNKKSFFDVISNKVKTFSEANLINQCDIFLPTSRQMRDDYLKNVKTRTFVIPSAIDPQNLKPNIQHEGEEKRFIYAGTLDKLREFETVLEAFSMVNPLKFKLMISTKDPEYAHAMLDSYPELQESIEIYNANSKAELLDLISQADVGLAPLPNIVLFNSSTPMKILDYYSSAIPCIMTKNENNQSLFENDSSAWLCEFTTNSIKDSIEKILTLSKTEITTIGLSGQKRLLEIRNYERIANDLAHQLDIM